jgi:hypothetical protein
MAISPFEDPAAGWCFGRDAREQSLDRSLLAQAIER